MISAWDCPITEMNIVVLCLKIPIDCWLWFSPWMCASHHQLNVCDLKFTVPVARRMICSKRQDKAGRNFYIRSGWMLCNFPSGLFDLPLEDRFITGKGQIDCLHLTKIKASSYSLNFCKTEFLRSHSIFQFNHICNLNLWCPDLPQVLHSSAWLRSRDQMEDSIYTRCHHLPLPGPDQTSSLLLKCTNHFYHSDELRIAANLATRIIVNAAEGS